MGGNEVDLLKHHLELRPRVGAGERQGLDGSESVCRALEGAVVCEVDAALWRGEEGLR